MFASARKALHMIFDRAFLGVVVKSLVFTLVLFAALFAATLYGVHHLPELGWPWLNTVIDWVAPIAVLIGFVFLGAPVAAVFASLFLDDIAEAVETRYYPADPKASGAPFFASLWAGLRLSGWVILTTLVLLPLDIFLPGAGEVLTLLVNGWLLGREFFELAALRHMTVSSAQALRRRHRFGVWSGGILIAVPAMVPLLNFFVPLFAAAFMVHLFKLYAHEERPV